MTTSSTIGDSSIQKVIYTVFSRLIGEPLAHQAVNLYQQQFATQGNFSVVRFMLACRTQFDIPTHATQALLQQLSQALRTPNPAQRPGLAKTADEAPSLPPIANTPVNAQATSVVFEFILSRLLAYLRIERDYVRDEVSLSNLPPAMKTLLTQWATGPTKPRLQLPEFTLEEMRATLNHLYSWCCDILGPITTDQILTQTMHQAQQLPEAIHFSPRRLL